MFFRYSSRDFIPGSMWSQADWNVQASRGPPRAAAQRHGTDAGQTREAAQRRGSGARCRHGSESAADARAVPMDGCPRRPAAAVMGWCCPRMRVPRNSPPCPAADEFRSVSGRPPLRHPLVRFRSQCVSAAHRDHGRATAAVRCGSGARVRWPPGHGARRAPTRSTGLFLASPKAANESCHSAPRGRPAQVTSPADPCNEWTPPCSGRASGARCAGAAPL